MENDIGRYIFDISINMNGSKMIQSGFYTENDLERMLAVCKGEFVAEFTKALVAVKNTNYRAYEERAVAHFEKGKFTGTLTQILPGHKDPWSYGIQGYS